MGTNVVSGTARAVVVATGNDTYFGSLARNGEPQAHRDQFRSRGEQRHQLLIRFMLVMVPIVFMLNGVSRVTGYGAHLRAGGGGGAHPEMLPMIVSSNLARGAVAMAKRKVVVKRLNSVQNFGAMDVLCTDKTGT
jgi:Mg2+-importing ATPase